MCHVYKNFHSHHDRYCTSVGPQLAHTWYTLGDHHYWEAGTAQNIQTHDYHVDVLPVEIKQAYEIGVREDLFPEKIGGLVCKMGSLDLGPQNGLVKTPETGWTLR